MRSALRFVLASIASALSVMVVLTLTMPIYLLATTGTVTGEGAPITLGALAFVLPFVIIIGGSIALPAAALAGSAMIFWQEQRGAPLTLCAWTFVGLASGILASLFFGTHDPVAARLIAAIWFACAGAAGAWVFRRMMKHGA
jgi:hypothetical protein